MNSQGTSAFAAESMPQNSGMPAMFEGFDPSQMQDGFGDQMPNMGEMPRGDRGSDMNGIGNAAQNSANLIWLAVSVLILGAALIIVKLYKH